MKNRFVAVIVCILLAFSFSTCKKKETQPPAPQAPGPMVTGPIQSEPPGQMPGGQMPSGPIMQGPIPPTGQQPMTAPGTMMPRGKAKIIVPNFVKGRWSAAKIIFVDKVTKQKQEYTIKLNSDFRVPNTNLRIHVGEYLPDFKMDGFNLTSASNEPKNPALSIQVFESDKQIFPAPGRVWGWLFAKVPSIHPFEHPKYGIILKEGIKKG